mgnify:CR=1 FL=1
MSSKGWEVQKAACVDNAINTPANEMWYPDVGTRANCGISESSLSDLDVISEDGRSQQREYDPFDFSEPDEINKQRRYDPFDFSEYEQ